MHCLRHLAILIVLVPMPSASPLLLAMMAMVAYLAVRPCGYCLATLSVVFFSTSPSSPFLAALAPETLVPTPPSAEPPQLSAPIVDRGAFFLNGGRVFDPCLVGYEKMRQVWSPPSPITNDSAIASEAQVAQESELPTDIDPSAEPSASEAKQPSHWPGKWKLGLSSSMFSARNRETPNVKPDTKPPALPSYPATPPARPLPPGYLDLRIGGVGLVLDLGWKRSEEGLDWELAENEHAAELARYRRAEREAGKQTAKESVESASDSWKGASFLGSW